MSGTLSLSQAFLQVLHFHADSDLAWHILPWAVETGRDAFTKAYGQPLFQALKEDPERERTFSRAMTSLDNTGGPCP